MPRNGKKRPPAEPIDVRMDEAGNLSCGRCGQSFPHMFRPRITTHVMALDADGLETRQVAPDVTVRVQEPHAEEWLEVMSIVAWSWKFDGATWRPTAEHRARRQWAREVMRRPDLHTDHDVRVARQGIATGRFSRTNKGRVAMGEVRPSLLDKEIAQRFDIPTEIECISCGVTNCIKHI
jgi:hypothetical protein